MKLHDSVRQDRDSSKAWIAALLSHELATPLNAILGSISLLDGECPTDRCGLVLVDRKHIDRMRRNGCHLRAMMDGVLKLLRAEAGELEVSFARGALGAVVDDALAAVELEARAKDVTIVNGVAGATDELSYWGDVTFVRHILVNLLANAIKFTATGGRVVLTAGWDQHGAAPGRDSRSPRIFVRVEDNGRGIPSSRLDRIFEPFQQAEAADRHRGSGLGLTICRQFARAMQGEIEVESEVGVGSAFTLWLAQHIDM